MGHELEYKNNYVDYLKRKEEELYILNSNKIQYKDVVIDNIKNIMDMKLRAQAKFKTCFLDKTYNCQNTSRNSQCYSFDKFNFEYEYQRYDMNIRIEKYIDTFYDMNVDNYEYVFTNCGMSALFSTLYALNLFSYKLEYLKNIYVETERLIDYYLQKNSKNNYKKNALLLDSVSFTGLNKNIDNNNLEIYDLFIIDTTLYLSCETKLVINKLRKFNKPIILVKSHTKMDMLGNEWATLGSICMIDADSVFKESLFKEIKIILSFIGGFAYQNSIPLYWFNDNFKKVSNNRNLAIKQNTQYIYEKLKKDFKNLEIIKPEHNMFILIVASKFIDYKTLENDLHKYTNNSILSGLINYADSFGLDCFGFSGYYENMSADTEVIRISPSDYSLDVCDLIYDDFAKWLKNYLEL